MILSPFAIAQNVLGMKLVPLIIALVLGALAAAAGPILRIQDLGTLGGSQMSGTAINQSGEVAGYGSDAMGNLRAFTTLGSPTDLAPTGPGSAAAYGVSGSGEVVGKMMVNGNSQATLWSHGVAQNLGGLGGPDSYANAINNQNQVAGMATNTAGQGRAVIYANGGVQEVSLPGSNWSSAYGINSAGAIAGYAMSGNGVFQAYTWSPTAGFSRLGTLGGVNSYSFAINDAGQVVGNSSVAGGYSHAFESDADGLHDLGTLGGNSSYAYGINGAGSVVGYSWLPSGNQTHAFIYMGGAIIDLNSMVSNLTGWTLTEAYGINDNGQITGSGLLNGVAHAFRLDPVAEGRLSASSQAVPEPGTTATLGIGIAVLAGKLLMRRWGAGTRNGVARTE